MDTQNPLYFDLAHKATLSFFLSLYDSCYLMKLISN